MQYKHNSIDLYEYNYMCVYVHACVRRHPLWQTKGEQSIRLVILSYWYQQKVQLRSFNFT